MKRVYMDANATTPLLPDVFAVMRPWLLESFGNASSIHQPGQAARAAVDRARAQVAGLLGCRPAEVVFTSGGTESDNLALFGASPPVTPDGQKPHLITTATEHHAVLHAAEALRDRGLCELTLLPCDASGLIQPATLASVLQPNTRLVSVIFANNETGTIQSIAELARLTHTVAGALFHTDAVQAAGKLPLDLSPAGPLGAVDLLSLSGHKLYAPQGTGALFVRRSVRLQPLFHGGTHERQRRAGTENVPGIVALGEATAQARAWLQGPKVQGATGQEPQNPVPGTAGPIELAALRDRLEQSLLSAIPESGVNGAGTERTPNTTNFFFDHVEAEALVIALDLKGLAVSGGSACQSGATEPSHVLTAMGLPPARARASIRISLSRLTTPEDVNFALQLIPDAVSRLRTLSPTWHRFCSDSMVV